MTVSLSLAVDRLMVNWPLLLGSAAVSSLAMTVTLAVSSSAMVTVAELAPGVASIAMSVSSVPVSVRMTVSESSSNALSIVSTSIVAVVWPAEIVTLPDKVEKSVPLSAVPVMA